MAKTCGDDCGECYHHESLEAWYVVDEPDAGCGDGLIACADGELAPKVGYCPKCGRPLGFAADGTPTVGPSYAEVAAKVEVQTTTDAPASDPTTPIHIETGHAVECIMEQHPECRGMYFYCDAEGRFHMLPVEKSGQYLGGWHTVTEAPKTRHTNVGVGAYAEVGLRHMSEAYMRDESELLWIVDELGRLGYNEVGLSRISEHWIGIYISGDDGGMTNAAPCELLPFYRRALAEARP